MMTQTTKCPHCAKNAAASRAAVRLVYSAVGLAVVALLMAGPSRAQSGYEWTFQLEHPDAVFELAGELEEISALSDGPGGMLLAVQDEEGYIYRLDPETGEVVRRDRFAGDGDYEGIEWVGEWIYVLESDGHFFRTPADHPSRNATVRIRLDLPGGCDAEGLGWDVTSEHFLVACKAADGVRGRQGRSVFAFKENGAAVGEGSPLIFLDEDRLETMGVKGLPDMRTSAVTIHPVSGRIFLLSSHEPALCSLDLGAPQTWACADLDLKTMRQPEGVTFDAQGRLWISSEARGKEPTLHRFDPIRDP